MCKIDHSHLPCQREVTLKEAQEIFRAIKGDEKSLKNVKLWEIKGLVFRNGFQHFMEANRDRLVIVEQGVRV